MKREKAYHIFYRKKFAKKNKACIRRYIFSIFKKSIFAYILAMASFFFLGGSTIEIVSSLSWVVTAGVAIIYAIEVTKDLSRIVYEARALVQTKREIRDLAE